jgi:hypothetical protein
MKANVNINISKVNEICKSAKLLNEYPTYSHHDLPFLAPGHEMELASKLNAKTGVYLLDNGEKLHVFVAYKWAFAHKEVEVGNDFEIGFGKYKGKKASEVPVDYINWMLQTMMESCNRTDFSYYLEKNYMKYHPIMCEIVQSRIKIA